MERQAKGGGIAPYGVEAVVTVAGDSFVDREQGEVELEVVARVQGREDRGKDARVLAA